MGSAPQQPPSPRFAPLPAGVEQPAFPSELPSHHLFQLRPLWGQLPALVGGPFRAALTFGFLLSLPSCFLLSLGCRFPFLPPGLTLSHTRLCHAAPCPHPTPEGRDPCSACRSAIRPQSHWGGRGATLPWPRCSRH